MTETTYFRESTDRACLPGARKGACAAVFIEVESGNGLSILRIRGRLATGADLDYLDAKLDQIRRLRSTRIVADLTELTSIGSTGISFLVLLYRMVNQQPEGSLVLAGANSLVRETLDLTGLSKIIPLSGA